MKCLVYGFDIKKPETSLIEANGALKDWDK